jgi:glyoxalase family protein
VEKLIRSLHHVTATADGAQEDLDCYGSLLGLRLVKKTVNFDNHNVYHFYYGNERGEPSTIWTTFPYRGWGVPVGTKGAGQITVTSFSVPAGALDFWKRRLTSAGVPVADVAPRFGEPAISFADPSGLVIELVGSDRDDRAPRVTAGVDAASAIRGLHSVTLTISSPARTLGLLTDVLGFEVVGEEASRTRLAVNGDAPGRTIEIVHTPDAQPARNGLGTVHHVALAISDADEQLRMRAELIRLGYQVTEVRDRQYFRSIYFREPGGVLFEIATVPPGFTVDETLPCLGQDLKLPPWEEPNRAEIEKMLPTVTVGSSQLDVSK